MSNADPLFPEPATANIGPMKRADPKVRYVRESTRRHAMAARERINRWYADLTDPSRNFARRLTSEVDSNFTTALDELTTHALLRTKFSDVRYEQPTQNPNGRVSDFCIYEAGAIAGVVEVVTMQLEDRLAQQETRHGRLADEIQSRVAPTNRYAIHFDFGSKQEPSPSRVASFIEEEISRLPPPEEVAPGAMIETTYREGGAIVYFKFMARRSATSSSEIPEMPISVFGASLGGWIQTEPRVKNALRSKRASRYNIEDTPYVITLFIHDYFSDIEDVANAILGTAHQAADGGVARRNNGFFSALKPDGQRQNTRVSGVAVFGDQLQSSESFLPFFPNPHARTPWPWGDFPTNANDPPANRGSAENPTENQ